VTSVNQTKPQSEINTGAATVAALQFYGPTGRSIGEALILRQARKAHVCQPCGRTIAIGTRYIEYVGETPAWQTGSPYCLQCGVIVWWDWLRPELRDLDKRAKPQ
jgi:hypothetical protein